MDNGACERAVLAATSCSWARSTSERISAGLLDAYGRLLIAERATRRGWSSPEAPDLTPRNGSTPSRRPPLAGHVEYLGYVPPNEREALFKGAQLFVLPSFEEGFGLPVLEAMAAGVPVVASNRGSLPEVIGDAGLLIDPDNPESLTDAMARIVGDSTLRATCARRGLDRARQFNWAQTARDVRRAYEDALMGRRERRVQSPKSKVQSPESKVQSLDAHRD